MADFDPRLCAQLPERLSVVPSHGESWTKKWANWWAGATIASPTTTMVVPALQCLATIRRLLDDVGKLNEYYVQETEYARQWVRDAIMAPASTPVILDASGTAAILTASRMLAHIAGLNETGRFFTLTTDEGGSLVPGALRGKNPNEFEKVMFQPVASVFYEPDPVLHYGAEMQISSRIVQIATKTDAEFVAEIRHELSQTTSAGCIVLPHVSKTGRILPIREVGQIVSELRSKGQEIYLIIDDIQGIGRVAPEAIADPLSFCDAYVFGSSKALGGILIASAIAMKEPLVARFLEKAQQLAAAGSTACISHYQFSPALQAQLPPALLKRGALSLPEIVSMRAGLHGLYTRGQGHTYSERRSYQAQVMDKRRQEVVAALTQLSGVEVLESCPGRPLVQSIVSFRAAGKSPAGLKNALQEGSTIITPSAPIGRYIRLDLPEYRPIPSVDPLVKRLSEVLS